MKKKNSNVKRKNPFTSDFYNNLDSSDPEMIDNLKQLADILQKESNGDPEVAKAILMQTLKDISHEVTPDVWCDTHPNSIKCGSDAFYADIASEIAAEFNLINTDAEIPDGAFYTAALSMAAYLEDIVSDTKIWQAVRNIYKRTYGSQLPFYETNPEDYFDDDINIEDMRVLSWQALCRCGANIGKTFSPLSQLIEKMSEIAFDILVDNFDTAPRATRVLDMMKKIFRTGDYYEVRLLALWINIQNPLTAAPFADEDLRDAAEDAMEELSDSFANSGFGFEEAYYFEKCYKSWMKYMSLLGCSTQTLLAEIAELHGASSIAEKIRDIESIPFMTYTIESTKGRYVILKDLFDKEYNVVKSSFGKGVDWDSHKSVIAAIVKFDNEYNQNGMSSFSDELPPKKIDSAYMHSVPKETIEVIDDIVNKKRGRRIFYCKTLQEVSEILDQKIEPIKPQYSEAMDDETDFLLMLSSSDGSILVDNSCAIFEDKKNPFFGEIPKDELGNRQYGFIIESSLPDDVIKYIVDHKLLSKASMKAYQGKRVGLHLVQDNLTFLFRFNRVTTYPIPEYLSQDLDDLDDFDDFDD